MSEDNLYNFLTEYKIAISSCQLISMENLSYKLSKLKITLYLKFLFPCDNLANDMILDKF